MLQHEFEDRIGRKVEKEEYIKANALYMSASNINKDDFCKEWDKIKDSKVLKIFDCDLSYYKKSLDDLRIACQNSAALLLDYIHENLDINDPRIVTAARNITSFRDVVRYRLENGYELDKEDTDFLISAIS